MGESPSARALAAQRVALSAAPRSDTLEGLLARLADGLYRLTVEERQRVLRLVVREVC